MKSYDAGPTDTPILEETIGENFERIGRPYPDAEALVDVAQRPALDLRRAQRRGRPVARGLMALGSKR